ncbi:DUF2244 domain-containing protein [Tropicibacter naphthalenivorans]|uniref:Integral membrane protein n=1 Tax=Tropicibacter naphthalenivorans TaxID=441103 RepID=A0A0P1G4E1_9RHOB|nr:DUF2244 domain-containing protein [Tropicibacter naphthalenivorans]CUH76610.1 hypothetical protein TRN7648_01026 [Tropicibacter naphthalenivorans]SMC64737.1 Uncharacterized membrane protein [Tropicibacter naphthalenivorans]
MPHTWTETSPPDARMELRAWPHNSLSAQGFAVMILGFFLFASIPLYGLLGTVLLWGLLPFMLAAVAGLYYALRRNERDRQILEVLTITHNSTRLLRTNPKGDTQEWEANTYWVEPQLHPSGGPVPFYVTLKGAGREVEIGAFLSEDERKALYGDLVERLNRARNQREFS